MNFKDLDGLRTKLLAIKKKGFIKSHRKDNTGIGKTLEDELGVKENNIPEGDIKVGNEIAEVKGQRKSAKSRVTLSTKEPTWILNKFDVINKTGYKDKKGRWGLKVTLNTKKFNKKNFRLEIKDNKVFIVHNSLGDVCFFDIEKLTELIKAKIGENLVLVLADVKKKSEIEFFHYINAIYYQDFNEQNFYDLIASGIIIWEFRLHLNSPTNIRDHGSGWRISRKYLDNLYNKRIDLF